MFNKTYGGLIVGALLATIDIFMMGILKKITLGLLSFNTWMPISVLLYTITPWLFKFGLNYTSMTVLNLSWDLLSDILVTSIGLFYFKEKITQLKLFGVLFAIFAILLFTIDQDN